MTIKTDTNKETETAIEVESLVAEENQTIVHCICGQDAAYRIWPSTFLIEHNSDKSKTDYGLQYFILSKLDIKK